MKPATEQLMENAGIRTDTPLWVSELALALKDPSGFAEIIRDESLIVTAELVDTFARFDAALRCSRAGVALIGREYQATLEAALSEFCQQCLEEGVRRGVTLIGWSEAELERHTTTARN